MPKILTLALKDLTLAFRDRAALVLMLLAPFALTLGLGFVTGRFSGATGGLSQIPVVLVNEDGGQLGNALVALFESDDLAELVAPIVLSDVAEARRQVSDDEIAAAVIIPAGFTDSIFESQQADVQLEVHVNPGREISSGVVQSIVEEFVSRVQAGSVGGAVAIQQLLASGRVQPQEAAAVAQELGRRQADAGVGESGLRLRATVANSPAAPRFDPLTFIAPGMALFFLMYTVSNGGRSILAERAGGTLPRLLLSPTTTAQVLGGKVFGIFLTGVTQVTVLIAASALLFGVRWGDWAGVAALVLAAAFGATGWGLILAALARTPAQVASLGSALMLTFGLVGGGLANIALPNWLDTAARFTPNRWGVEAFTILGAGGALADITPNLIALVVMGAALFGVAVFVFGRRGMISSK
jgi:ABC-2 type transport system permease protein